MAVRDRARVFIDGEAGTTGLGIRERLAALPWIEIKSLPPQYRKDTGARRDLMAEVDLAVLCLPDDAAREAVALAGSLGEAAPRLLDASTAHRVSDGWTYGLPELAPDQPDAIRTAPRVANPGCYPTGAVALLRPLVDALLLPADYPITIHAVSGYSGGGRSMIETHERGPAPSFELYGLGLDHKHVPETQLYARLARRPIFVPSVGSFRQGMLVTIGLHLDLLCDRPSALDLQSVLEERYRESELLNVIDVAADDGRIEPEALNGTDRLELRVYSNEARNQALLVARLDNLGKGASGAAVQNIALMLGETRPVGTTARAAVAVA